VTRRAALLLLAAALAGCGGSSKPAGPAVPDVRGQNLPDAIVAVLHARLCPRLRQTPEAWGSKREPVVGESPAPGTHLRRWSTVVVTARIPQPPGAKGKRATHFDFFGFGGANLRIPCGPVSP
jgi:beta-lactam-binding protein with PASTA domain